MQTGLPTPGALRSFLLITLFPLQVFAMASEPTLTTPPVTDPLATSTTSFPKVESEVLGYFDTAQATQAGGSFVDRPYSFLQLIYDGDLSFSERLHLQVGFEAEAVNSGEFELQASEAFAEFQVFSGVTLKAGRFFNPGSRLEEFRDFWGITPRLIEDHFGNEATLNGGSVTASWSAEVAELPAEIGVEAGLYQSQIRNPLTSAMDPPSQLPHFVNAFASLGELKAQAVAFPRQFPQGFQDERVSVRVEWERGSDLSVRPFFEFHQNRTQDWFRSESLESTQMLGVLSTWDWLTVGALVATTETVTNSDARSRFEELGFLLRAELYRGFGLQLNQSLGSDGARLSLLRVTWSAKF